MYSAISGDGGCVSSYLYLYPSPLLPSPPLPSPSADEQSTKRTRWRPDVHVISIKSVVMQFAGWAFKCLSYDTHTHTHTHTHTQCAGNKLSEMIRQRLGRSGMCSSTTDSAEGPQTVKCPRFSGLQPNGDIWQVQAPSRNRWTVVLGPWWQKKCFISGG